MMVKNEQEYLYDSVSGLERYARNWNSKRCISNGMKPVGPPYTLIDNLFDICFHPFV